MNIDADMFCIYVVPVDVGIFKLDFGEAVSEKTVGNPVQHGNTTYRKSNTDMI
jgi:hypothetical protein